MTSYERKIMNAWQAINKQNDGKGASAHEVTVYMTNSGTISELDSVIDIADQLRAMAERGYFR